MGKAKWLRWYRPAVMASIESNVKHASKAISEDGFHIVDDETVGQNMAEMDEEGTPLASAAGLRFCKDNVLDNSNIREILNAFFDWFGLGLYRSFSARHGDYVFLKNDPKYPEIEGKCLLVHLFSKGSVATLWKSSHRQTLHTFEQGGFIVLDPRTAVEISQGGTATLAFGTKEVAETWWKPIEIPRSREIEYIIDSMVDSTFGMNVKYI